MPPAVVRRFAGSTIVCLGSGPSLTSEDVTFCRSRAITLAINDTYTVAPWASVLFASDLLWWARNSAARRIVGLKYALASAHERVPGVEVLDRTGQEGLELEPTGLRSGGHSGYAAINLAVHLGARRIVLLGYDMQSTLGGKHHYFGAHPDGSHPRYDHWRGLYATLLDPLTALGISLVNASRATSITAVPRIGLREALCPN